MKNKIIKFRVTEKTYNELKALNINISDTLRKFVKSLINVDTKNSNVDTNVDTTKTKIKKTVKNVDTNVDTKIKKITKNVDTNVKTNNQNVKTKFEICKDNLDKDGRKRIDYSRFEIKKNKILMKQQILNFKTS